MAICAVPYDLVVVKGSANTERKSIVTLCAIVGDRRMLGGLERRPDWIAFVVTGYTITRHHIMIQIDLGEALFEERRVTVVTGLGRGYVIYGFTDRS